MFLVKQNKNWKNHKNDDVSHALTVGTQLSHKIKVLPRNNEQYKQLKAI